MSETMRRIHPVKLGETIDGKRVVMTCWRWSKDTGDVPAYQLAGESDLRLLKRAERKGEDAT